MTDSTYTLSEGNVTISVEADAADVRTGWTFVVVVTDPDTGVTYTSGADGENTLRCPLGADRVEAVGTAASFLSAWCESVSYSTREGHEGENADLFTFPEGDPEVIATLAEDDASYLAFVAEANPFASGVSEVPETLAYTPIGVTSDGDVLCVRCVTSHDNDSIRDWTSTPDRGNGTGWEIVGWSHTGNEDAPEGVYCAHCNAEIVAPDEDPEDAPSDPVDTASPFGRAMADGHRARTGHDLVAHYVTDAGLHRIVRDCCDES